jgi:hypothetical protein
MRTNLNEPHAYFHETNNVHFSSLVMQDLSLMQLQKDQDKIRAIEGHASNIDPKADDLIEANVALH